MKASWVIPEIKVLDIYGKCLLTIPLNGKNGFIDISWLPSGIYILAISKESKKIQRKIMVL
jgi:hypothetical protein